jgi:hypothetical protein
VIVERVPRGFDEAARELNISYLDLRGNGRVVAPGFVYVVRARHAAPFAWRGRSSPFAPKASRLVRAPLARPNERWRLLDLTRQVDVDPGNAHRILGTLVESGFVERDGEEYVPLEPGALLEAWADATAPARESISLPVALDLRTTVDELIARSPQELAVSGEMAAELFVPWLRAESAIVHCVSAPVWHDIVDDEQFARRPPTREKVIVNLADAGVGHFGEERDGLSLVSPAQNYIDLAHAEGRARDAAERVREQLLGY